MTSLRVLILSDGVPGHVNQARGLVSWLSRHLEIECVEQEVRLRARPLARLLLPYVLRVPGLGDATSGTFYSRNGSEETPPDLIVSAGGNTSFLNIALARKWSVPNIFMGSRRRLHSNDFSAHLTLEPTGEPHNVVMDLVPTVTNLSEQRDRGLALRNSLQIEDQQQLYCLVVGGAGVGFVYGEAEWGHVGELVKCLSERDNCRWLVTTSRRTGSACEQMLRRALPPSLLVDSVWWSEKSREVMTSYLGAADAVFVTADSMTMVNEAIASQKPTVVLAPENANPPERHLKALQRFQGAGYCKLHRLGSGVPSLPDYPARDDRTNNLVFLQLKKLIPCLR